MFVGGFRIEKFSEPEFNEQFSHLSRQGKAEALAQIILNLQGVANSKTSLKKFMIAHRVNPKGLIVKNEALQKAFIDVYHKTPEQFLSYSDFALGIWNANQAKDNSFERNKNYLSILIKDVNVSDEDICLVLIGAKVEENYFEALSELISTLRPNLLNKYKKCQEEMTVSSLFVVWDQNAASGSLQPNKIFLESLIKDSSLTDDVLCLLLKRCMVRPGRFYLTAVSQLINELRPEFLGKYQAMYQDLSASVIAQAAKEAAFPEAFSLEIAYEIWQKNQETHSTYPNMVYLEKLIENKNIDDKDICSLLKRANVRINGHYLKSLSSKILTSRPDMLDIYSNILASPVIEPVTPIVVPAAPVAKLDASVAPIIAPTPQAPAPIAAVAAPVFVPEAVKSEELELISQLSATFADVKQIAKAMTATFPMVIPEIKLSQDELDQMSTVEEKIQEFEEYLSIKYKVDFSTGGFNWHGRISLQRLLWQDEKFLELIQDPLAVKVILNRAQEKKEKVWKAGTTISGLMFYGLSSQRLDYLTTAAPNWYNAPQVDNIDWKILKAFTKLIPETSEHPHILTNKYLENLSKSLSTIQAVLASEKKDFISPENILYKEVDSASSIKLLNSFYVMISDFHKINDFTQSAAPLTDYPNMLKQCLSIMTNYDKLLEHHHGDHGSVFGYGIISHGIDARHLAAGIYALENDPAHPYLLAYAEGAKALSNLIMAVKDGSLPQKDHLLFKIRLQQILTLIIDESAKLDLNLENIEHVLQSAGE